jgi:hypothetical protein
MHLECTNYWGSMWQHIQNGIDSFLHTKMVTIYYNLNKKNWTLYTHNHNNKSPQPQETTSSIHQEIKAIFLWIV